MILTDFQTNNESHVFYEKLIRRRKTSNVFSRCWI